MSPRRIKQLADLQSLKHATAECIRKALDAARKAAEAAGEDPDDFEAQILDLVNEEDPEGFEAEPEPEPKKKRVKSEPRIDRFVGGEGDAVLPEDFTNPLEVEISSSTSAPTGEGTDLPRMIVGES